VKKRPLLAGLILASALVVPAAMPAVAATPAENAAAALRNDPVYVDPAAEAASVVDVDALRRQIKSGSTRIVVAVLPASAANSVSGGADGLPAAIGSSLGGRDTVGVLVGNSFRAASDALPRGEAQSLANGAVSAHPGTGLTADRVNGALRDFVSSVQRARPLSSGRASSGSSTGSSSDSGSGAGALAILVVAVLLIGGGIGFYIFGRRRRQRRALQGARAEVLSAYDRLGSDVSTLQPGDDATAKQALADAAERYSATGSLLSSANSEREYAAARRTALEGLAATRVVRQRNGLDPGPEIRPEEATNAPQLDQQRAIAVGGNQYTGYPQYTPGSPYYYGGGMLGGGMVPGGWYAMPFWETMLIGSALGGGFGYGGGWGGGGYERGYDSGYEEGREDAGDRGGDSGGGGDWGGGGGDFGGGGDWGGGGGDFGGGGDWGGGGGGGGDF